MTPSTDPEGTFPHPCSTCGVVCETIEELTDPKHHDWPRGSA